MKLPALRGDSSIIEQPMTAMKSLVLRNASSSDSDFAYSTKRSAFKQYVEEVWGWDEREQRQ